MAGFEDEGVAGDLEGGKSAQPIDPARAFDRKPLWARLIVILAGVTMNAVFAVLVYTGLAYTGTLEPNNIATTRVDSVIVTDLPPAAQALGALRRGDRITTVNGDSRSEEHTSELQSQSNLVCRLLLEKKKKTSKIVLTSGNHPLAQYSMRR